MHTKYNKTINRVYISYNRITHILVRDVRQRRLEFSKIHPNPRLLSVKFDLNYIYIYFY
jgi:hypothetical protein